MHRLAGWLGHGSADAVQTLELMRAHCSVARPAHVHADPDWAMTANLPLAIEGDLAGVITGRPRFDGAEFQNQPAASALLALWRRHGPDAPKHIHGTFALAVLDKRQQSVFLALDRIGAEKLAFAANSTGMVFASQADMVAAHPAVGRELNPQGLFNFLYFYQVPAPGSVFKGVEKLLPAQWALWKKGELSKGFYWALHYRDEPRDDFAAQSERFHTLLRESVARAKGDDNASAFLSGGTDSSTVSGVLKEIAGKADTYSIGFDADGFDEMEYARLAAKRFGLDMHEYYLKPADIVEAIPLIASHYDEPFANESAVPTYFCAKLAAADGYKVMLAGDGGDEIFGGNARYAKQKVFEIYHQIPSVLRSGLIEPLANLPGLGNIAPFSKAQSYIRQANIPLPERMESYNYVYRQPLNEMFAPGFLASVDSHQPSELLKEVYDRADSTSYINRMLHLDIKFTLADSDLRKVGAMTEAAGIDVRYPLLDDAMMDFSGEVPPDWKVKGQYLRWFFKTALKGFLPDEIIDKSKHGFGLPFGVWAKDYAPLRERIEDRLSDLKKRDILQPAYIDLVRNEHMSGHATYFGKMIWNMMILEEWLQAKGL
ncbi:MAG: asparagine synthase [Hydrogenophilales bacterium 28-61-23]|nr:MAG: asparagine synthase [Hydrogenophilales bacterium 28-61-23]